MNAPTGDRAGERYWDDVWAAADAADMNPATPGFRNRVDRSFDAMFRAILPERPFELIEVGCAHSPWLAHFAREHGARVCGLDYSERGCEIERAMLRDAGVDGEVVCGDLFEPPMSLRARFDVVVSFGVMEHFDDTTAAARALAAYLTPGGVVVTVIPNMTGAIGRICA